MSSQSSSSSSGTSICSERRRASARFTTSLLVPALLARLDERDGGSALALTAVVLESSGAARVWIRRPSDDGEVDDRTEPVDDLLEGDGGSIRRAVVRSCGQSEKSERERSEVKRVARGDSIRTVPGCTLDGTLRIACTGQIRVASSNRTYRNPDQSGTRRCVSDSGESRCGAACATASARAPACSQ